MQDLFFAIVGVEIFFWMWNGIQQGDFWKRFRFRSSISNVPTFWSLPEGRRISQFAAKIPLLLRNDGGSIYEICCLNLKNQRGGIY